MNKFVRIKIFLMTGVLAAGCAPVPPPPQEPVQVDPAEETQNEQVLETLSVLTEIKQELKQLRNSVEELEFETGYSKRRQRDLFQDIDRRLTSLERNAPTPGSETQGPLLNNENGQGVADNALSQDTSADTGDSDSQEAGENGEVPVAAEPDDPVSSIPEVPESDSVTLEEQQAYEAAFDLLKQSLYEDAIDRFQQLAETWPNSQLADDAYYWMSEAMYVIREFEHALKGFRALVVRYPDSQRVPEALLKIGYIQYDIGAYDDAAETFRDVLSRFPGHQVTVSAQTRLRRIEQTIQE